MFYVRNWYNIYGVYLTREEAEQGLAEAQKRGEVSEYEIVEW